MTPSDILRAIDRLVSDLDKKCVEYSECQKRDAPFAIKKKLRLEVRAIEKNISDFKAQLEALSDVKSATEVDQQIS